VIFDHLNFGAFALKESSPKMSKTNGQKSMPKAVKKQKVQK